MGSFRVHIALGALAACAALAAIVVRVGSQWTLITIGPLQWIRTRAALIKVGVRYEPGLGSLAR